MPNLIQLPDEADLLVHSFGGVEDFENYTTAGRFTTVASDSGTVSVSDGAKGILAIVPSDGSVGDNDESYVKGTNETFLMAANKSIWFEALVQFAEANTDDANVIVGMVNAVAGDLLVDNGAGPKASFSGFVFYKVDGGTVWRCRSSVGTSYTDSITNVTAGGSAYQRLSIEFRAIDSTLGEVSFLIDGAVVNDSNNRPIKHQITFTGATEMQIGAGVKNGGTNLETLNVDYFAWRSSR